jgi:hypothetical protein
MLIAAGSLAPSHATKLFRVDTSVQEFAARCAQTSAGIGNVTEWSWRIPLFQRDRLMSPLNQGSEFNKYGSIRGKVLHLSTKKLIEFCTS